MLPPDVDSLSVHALPVADVSIDLDFQRAGDDVVVAPTGHREAGVRVLAHL